MIGKLKPKSCKLPNSIKSEYKTIYCSICNAIRKNYGVIYTPLVNYEVTLIILSLRKYFKPTQNNSFCPQSLLVLKKQTYSHPIFDIASDICLLLGSLKLIDNQLDNKKSIKKYFEKVLLNKIKRKRFILNQSFIKYFTEYEKKLNQVKNYDEIIIETDKLARIIYNKILYNLNIEDKKLLEFSEMFGLIGKITAVADPLLDILSDLNEKKSNPILERSENIRTNLLTNYQEYLDKYEKITSDIKTYFDIINKTEILTSDFLTILSIGINTLSSKIYKKRAELKNYMSGKNKNFKKYPIYIPILLRSDCCGGDDCCEDCCEECCCECCCDCCEDCCCSCDC